MSRANYIIFHPDSARDKVTVMAHSLVGNRLNKKWIGDIWVDAIGNGNEDPYVFNDGWIYSYCHASQLRRKRSKNYIQEGSWLIFCSGDKANDGFLCVDTVFQIGSVHEWTQKPHLELPSTFKSVKRTNTDLWQRHFRFPFDGHHDSVSHSYEAILGPGSSFLPLYKKERVCIEFDAIPQDIARKIGENVRGKYPVNLTDQEIFQVVALIRKNCDTQVLRNIKLPKAQMKKIKLNSGC